MKTIPESEKKCIWMDAGVVGYKLCPIEFNCSDCDFDKALRLKIAKTRSKPGPAAPTNKPPLDKDWIEKFRNLPASQRKCRYMLQGQVSYKLCANNFQCGRCSYDQMMQDSLIPAPAVPLDLVRAVEGFHLPSDLYFHRGHSWARSEYAGKLRVGMDDFSRRLMGKVDDVDIPPVGRRIRQGEPAWKVRRDSEVVDVLAPIEGVVSQVNDDVSNVFSQDSHNPYGEGWLFVIEPVHLQQNLRGLMYGEDAEAWMKEEVRKLDSVVQSEAGVAMMADGGTPVNDIFMNLEDVKWGPFVKKFLLS